VGTHIFTAVGLLLPIVQWPIYYRLLQVDNRGETESFTCCIINFFFFF
jgi:hypothetical protein